VEEEEENKSERMKRGKILEECTRERERERE
jgi:hypothetical protein